MAGKLAECECHRLLMAYIDELKAVSEYGELAGKIGVWNRELSETLSKKLMVDEAVHADTLRAAIKRYCPVETQKFRELVGRCER